MKNRRSTNMMSLRVRLSQVGAVMNVVGRAAAGGRGRGFLLNCQRVPPLSLPRRGCPGTRSPGRSTFVVVVVVTVVSRPGFDGDLPVRPTCAGLAVGPVVRGWLHLHVDLPCVACGASGRVSRCWAGSA